MCIWLALYHSAAPLPLNCYLKLIRVTLEEAFSDKKVRETGKQAKETRETRLGTLESVEFLKGVDTFPLLNVYSPQMP